MAEDRVILGKTIYVYTLFDINSVIDSHYLKGEMRSSNWEYKIGGMIVDWYSVWLLSLGLLVVSIMALVVGLIKPEWVIRWGDPSIKSRQKVIAIYGVACLLLYGAVQFSYVQFRAEVQRAQVWYDEMKKKEEENNQRAITAANAPQNKPGPLQPPVESANTQMNTPNASGSTMSKAIIGHWISANTFKVARGRTDTPNGVSITEQPTAPMHFYFDQNTAVLVKNGQALHVPYRVEQNEFAEVIQLHLNNGNHMIGMNDGGKSFTLLQDLSSGNRTEVFSTVFTYVDNRTKP